MSYDKSDYDYEPKSGSSSILRLREKGQKVRLRLITKPHRIVSTFDKDGEKETKEQFVWGAIDKTEKEPKAVAFVGGLMIYIAVKHLAQNDDWGHPANYDVVIERTEKQGSYYVVTPIAKGMGAPPKEHIDMIAELEKAVDLSNPFAKRAESTAKNGSNEEYDPFADTDD